MHIHTHIHSWMDPVLAEFGVDVVDHIQTADVDLQGINLFSYSLSLSLSLSDTPANEHPYTYTLVDGSCISGVWC